VDFEHGVVRVRRSVESTKAGLRVKSPKTKAGTRTVPLMRQAAGVLTAWQDSGDAAESSSSWVIPSGTAEPMAPGRVSSRWQTWSKRKENTAKYGPLRFHDLRHSAASFWLVSGVSLFEVSRWLGHSTIQVTADTYGHLLVDSAAGDRVSDQFDAVLVARAKAAKTAAKRTRKSA
jgi:integrase